MPEPERYQRILTKWLDPDTPGYQREEYGKWIEEADKKITQGQEPPPSPRPDPPNPGQFRRGKALLSPHVLSQGRPVERHKAQRAYNLTRSIR